MKIRLLPGRIVIREDYAADHAHLRHILVPEIALGTDDKDALAKKREWHRGKVLAVGAPAKTEKGAEVARGFEVGDEVIFHWTHLERAWTIEWIDGERACVVPQEAVDAVVHGGKCYVGPFADVKDPAWAPGLWDEK